LPPSKELIEKKNELKSLDMKINELGEVKTKTDILSKLIKIRNQKQPKTVKSESESKERLDSISERLNNQLTSYISKRKELKSLFLSLFLSKIFESKLKFILN
jgi:hypothetical protein